LARKGLLRLEWEDADRAATARVFQAVR
jgi:hypothetical protein